MSHGALIANFLIKWNLESYVLLRIRVIMAILTILYMILFLSSVFSRRRMFASMVNILDPVADAILVYIMGAMQAAPFKNQLFPIWALILVALRSSIHGLSSSGTFFELKNVSKLLVVAYMALTHGSKLWHVPFWSFWSLLALQCLYRILTRHVASKSLWNGRSSELLQAYMGANGNDRNFKPERCNPQTMEEYKYFVYGESQKSRKNGHSLSVRDLRQLVTLDKIWQCDDGVLLRSINRHGNNMKDVALAFALSRLLRCRLEGATLHEATVYMTRKLISERILSDNAEKVLFGILEMDVEFLLDFLHTSYPMVFCSGIASLFFSLMLSYAKFSMAIWLVVDVRRMMHIQKSGPDGGHSAHRYFLNSFAYDFSITGVSMYLVLVAESVSMTANFLRKWIKLIAVCRYVNFRDRLHKYLIMMNTYVSLVEITTFMRQHVFMQPFSSSMSVWKLISCILEIIQKARGVSSEWKMYAITVNNVKAAVIQALRSMDLEGHPPSRDLPLLRVSDRAEPYWLACFAEAPTCSHVILVWHIATGLCEIKLANDHSINLTTMSRLSSFLGKTLTGELQKAYTMSNCLSRYCMYLLASKPKLLPETILMSKKAFQDAVQCAHEMLSDCHSCQSIYNKLMEEAQEALVPGTHGLNLSGNILQQAAILANALINKEDEKCRWEILSDVWVHLLLQIAPSSDTAAIAEDLKSDVEFITVIWALFCHCGIEKSELWQQQKSANFRNNTPGPSNQSSDVSTHVQDTVSSSPTAARSPEIHVEASPTSGMS